MERTDPAVASSSTVRRSPHAGCGSLDEPARPDTRPGTATVLVWLTVAAVIGSYLCGYALTNALVAAELLQRWPRDQDPRPRWMLAVFCGLWIVFASAGASLRWTSRRQLLGIDAMAADPEPSSEREPA